MRLERVPLLSAGHMFLMIGPALAPLPAPLPVVEALQSLEITTSSDRSGFQMKLLVGKDSPLQLAMLPAGFFDPLLCRIVVTVVISGIPWVIMDGVVTRHDLQPGNKPGQSTLNITGEDLSILMDVIELRVPYAGTPEIGQIASILGRYGMFGVTPMIIPPAVTVTDSPTSRFDSQDGTDRAHIRAIAEEAGYVFYVEPGPLPTRSIGYFGPEIRIPVPQPALSINLDSETNVEQLSFSFDGLAPKTTTMFVYDPATHKIPIPIPVPNVDPLRPPLGARPPIPAKVSFTRDTSHLTFSAAARRAYEIMKQSATPVTGRGTLDVGVYGQPLKARMLVGVRGAGVTYDGLYFVDSVTHNLKPGGYKQNFELSRSGLVSPTPVVVP
jgi:hypothetical protein